MSNYTKLRVNGKWVTAIVWGNQMNMMFYRVEIDMKLVWVARERGSQQLQIGRKPI